jgi:uncharacterized protein (TIGR03086 family)
VLTAGSEEVAEASAVLADVLAQVGSADWVAPTPCTAWSVSQVLNHVVATLTKFSLFAEGRTAAPRTPSGDMLSPDPLTAFAAARERARTAWADVEPERRCRLPFGEFSAREAAAIAAFDVLLHAWDIAQGIGVPVRSPSEGLRKVAASVAERLVTDDAVADGFYVQPQPGPEAAGWEGLLWRTGRVPPNRV